MKREGAWQVKSVVTVVLVTLLCPYPGRALPSFEFTTSLVAGKQVGAVLSDLGPAQTLNVDVLLFITP